MDETLTADGYEGVTVAGVAIVASDTGRVFLAKRTMDETDDPEVQETWEFPGGHLNPDEDPQAAAFREFSEEIGFDIPDGEVVDGWRSEDGHYQAFIYLISQEFATDTWKPTDEVQAIGWYGEDGIIEMSDDGTLRPEVRDQTDWNKVFNAVSGNQEERAMSVDFETEPVLSMTDMTVIPIPIHGVMAPEDTESGDGRGFEAGAITARPLRLPFSWQEVSAEHHLGSIVVGSVDRLMRKDGLIHWEGLLMCTPEAGKFVDLLEFFGQYGVSIDGDRGSINADKTEATQVLWYDAVRAAGLTAVSIPAFAEAYVALGWHPDMPDTEEAMVASGYENFAGARQTFDRGPGWVTNPKETKRLHDYWTKKGQPGYAKIAWGTSGDYTRCVSLVGEKIAANSPEKSGYIKQICAQWHHDALGYWPGDLGKPGNAPDTPENRRRAATHASSEDTPEFGEWEQVLTAAGSPKARKRVFPPAEYFSFHPDTDATVIEEPDAQGFRRTYGYAGEWGVCHIGHTGRCTEVPMDPTGGDYPEFHLGRTKLADGSYVKTGLITYGVAHRGAEEILAQSATQAHFDDLSHAWAAVVLGEDDRGIWFSGVVLPTVEDKWLTAIEASGQVSGEWKYGALRTLLTVNVPGFPVLRSSAAYDDEGNLIALAASALSAPFKVCEPPEDGICGMACEDGSKCTEPPTMGVWVNPEMYDMCCEAHVEALQAEHACAEAALSPAERMAALRQEDAMARFEIARDLWLEAQDELRV